MTKEQIDRTFQYHRPFGNMPQRYETIRSKAKELAEVFAANGFHSRELALAFTNLQQAVMWANASIAINEIEPKPE
tara:strand:- start:175 stop:402 length:228 start_codon:yes stop_codon:yes gene_type:complete